MHFYESQKVFKDLYVDNIWVPLGMAKPLVHVEVAPIRIVARVCGIATP